MGQASFGEPTEITTAPVVAVATPAAEPQVFIDEGARQAIQQLDGFLANFQKSAITDLQNIANNINEKTKVIDSHTESISGLKHDSDEYFQKIHTTLIDIRKQIDHEVARFDKNFDICADHIEKLNAAKPPEPVVAEISVPIVVQPKTPKAVWVLAILNLILITIVFLK